MVLSGNKILTDAARSQGYFKEGQIDVRVGGGGKEQESKVYVNGKLVATTYTKRKGGGGKYISPPEEVTTAKPITKPVSTIEEVSEKTGLEKTKEFLRTELSKGARGIKESRIGKFLEKRAGTVEYIPESEARAKLKDPYSKFLFKTGKFMGSSGGYYSDTERMIPVQVGGPSPIISAGLVGAGGLSGAFGGSLPVFGLKYPVESKSLGIITEGRAIAGAGEITTAGGKFLQKVSKIVGEREGATLGVSEAARRKNIPFTFTEREVWTKPSEEGTITASKGMEYLFGKENIALPTKTLGIENLNVPVKGGSLRGGVGATKAGGEISISDYKAFVSDTGASLIKGVTYQKVGVETIQTKFASIILPKSSFKITGTQEGGLALKEYKTIPSQQQLKNTALSISKSISEVTQKAIQTKPSVTPKVTGIIQTSGVNLRIPESEQTGFPQITTSLSSFAKPSEATRLFIGAKPSELVTPSEKPSEATKLLPSIVFKPISSGGRIGSGAKLFTKEIVTPDVGIPTIPTIPVSVEPELEMGTPSFNIPYTSGLWKPGDYNFRFTPFKLSLPSGGVGRGFKIGRFEKQPKEYHPSLFSSVLGVKSKQLNTMWEKTGLSIRPILISKKKKRK